MYKRQDGHLLEYFRNTFVEGGAGTNAPQPQGIQASGGVISEYTDSGTVYRSHTFTGTGTFEVSAAAIGFPNNVEFLLVAGGGAGGDNVNGAHGGNGGGGAGGLVEGNALPITGPSSFTVTIGGGGGAIGAFRGSPAPNRSGSNSTIAGPTLSLIHI